MYDIFVYKIKMSLFFQNGDKYRYTLILKTDIDNRIRILIRYDNRYSISNNISKKDLSNTYSLSFERKHLK